MNILIVLVLLAFGWGEIVMAASSSASGKALNPDLSLNFLGLIQRGTGLSESRNASSYNGISLQEAELQVTADVDVYFRANAVLALKKENSAFKIDPEEIYAETISVPVVTFKAGKFKAAIGRHNLLHTHAYPFIKPPSIHQTLLGDEGLNDAGVSAAVLIPAPWFFETTVQAMANGNTALFGTDTRAGDWAFIGHLKNLFDLSSEATLEVGGSFARGSNGYSGVGTTTLAGGDLTLKWRPEIDGKARAIIWSNEYLYGNRQNGLAAASPVSDSVGGFATWVQFQVAERWWVQARFDFSGIPRALAADTSTRQSLLVAFLPTEFSGFRVEYDRDQSNDNVIAHTIALQFNLSIGAHPAHAY